MLEFQPFGGSLVRLLSRFKARGTRGMRGDSGAAPINPIIGGSRSTFSTEFSSFLALFLFSSSSSSCFLVNGFSSNHGATNWTNEIFPSISGSIVGRG